MTAQFSLAPFLSGQQARVNELLAERLNRLAPLTAPRLFEAMKYSLLGKSKRLRPILCLAFADSLAVSSEEALDTACALEFVHTYSLIHDDLPAMDDDDLRRGQPTSHKVFGEAMAILAGDALLTEAFALLGERASGPRARLCGELATAAGARGMVSGQVLDIADDRPAQARYLVELHSKKTGALIRAACRMGVVAAGGTEKQIDLAGEYGAAVGLAFQIADDLLDVTSSREKLGKAVGADAAARRATFPAVLGIDASKKLAQEYVDQALTVALTFEPVEGPLAALARYAIEREE